MRYLITGITGFVGPHLAKLLLEQGHGVVGLVRCANGREFDIADVLGEELMRQMEFIYGDITNRQYIDSLFKSEKFDGVFHLAAQSHPPTSFEEPELTFLTNTHGTMNIVWALREHQPECRLMNCSTSEVYGVVPEEDGLITEDFPVAPVSPYGLSKALADSFVLQMAKTYNLPFFCTRAFSHTGPRRGHKFSIASDAVQIVKICRCLQDPVIRVGTLGSRRAVADVRDICKAYYLLMQNGIPGEAYNVGGSNIYSMGELLDEMLEIAKERIPGGSVYLKDVEKLVDPKLVRPVDIPLQQCNTSKLRKLTGWRPEIPIEATLDDLLKYWYNKTGS